MLVLVRSDRAAVLVRSDHVDERELLVVLLLVLLVLLPLLLPLLLPPPPC